MDKSHSPGNPPRSPLEKHLKSQDFHFAVNWKSLTQLQMPHGPFYCSSGQSKRLLGLYSLLNSFI